MDQKTSNKPRDSLAGILQNGEEKAKTECCIKGTVPTWLSGKILRNGPGEFDIGSETFNHWFDGHALLHKFEINDGKVTYSSKFIQSNSYKTNHKYNRIVIGGFGTASIADPCKNIFARFFTHFTSTQKFDDCNVNIANLGNVYYAVTDANIAYRIDEKNLDTKNLIKMQEILGISTTTAHPHYDKNGDYYNLGQSFGRQAYYNVVKIPAMSMKKDDPMQDLKIVAKIPIDDRERPSYFHSFALSENYIVMHDQTVRLNVCKLLWMQVTWDAFIKAMEHEKERESVFHVVDKKTGKKIPIKFAAKGKFCFHHINSYEEEHDGKRFLILDMCCSDAATFNWLGLKYLRSESTTSQQKNDVAPMLPTRYILPLDITEKTSKGTNLITLPGCKATAVMREDDSVFLTPQYIVPDDVRRKHDISESIELPSINYDEYNGKKYRYIYSVGETGPFPDKLLKVDIDTQDILVWKQKNLFPSEPVFVKRPGGLEEDDGIILSTVISTKEKDSTFLLILDAKTFNEIGRAEVDAKLPYPLHGIFRS